MRYRITIRLAALAALVGTVALALLMIEGTARATNVDRCPNQPDVLKVVDGAHARAVKGWNRRTLRKDPQTIERVRTQARCVPTKNGRKHVKEQIDRAREQYKVAKEAARVPDLTGVSAAYEKFAVLLWKADDRLDPRVMAAWAVAENCGSGNPLCIRRSDGGFGSFGSVEAAAKASVDLIHSTFPSIPASCCGTAQISAILGSGWGTVGGAISAAYGSIGVR